MKTVYQLISLLIFIFIIWLLGGFKENKNDQKAKEEKPNSIAEKKKVEHAATYKMKGKSQKPGTKTNKPYKSQATSSIRKDPTTKVVSPELKKLGINYLFHMTHINNITSIYKNGLVSNHLAHESSMIKKDISDPDVQLRRERLDPINNLSIHSYVPLYFNPKNPMLYVRKEMQNKIALLVFDANSIFQYKGTIFSDGNAASGPTKYYSKLTDLVNLDWACLNTTSYWNDFIDGKRKRCAEVLVPNNIKFEDVITIVVYDNYVASKIRTQLNNKIEVKTDGRFYF